MRYNQSTDYVHFFNNCYGGFRYSDWFKNQYCRLDRIIHNGVDDRTTKSIAVICLYFYAKKTNRLNGEHADIQFRVCSSTCISNNEYDGKETPGVSARYFFKHEFDIVDSIPNTKIFMKELEVKEKELWKQLRDNSWTAEDFDLPDDEKQLELLWEIYATMGDNHDNKWEGYD